MIIRFLAILLYLMLCSTTSWADPVEVKVGVLAKRGYEKSHQRWDATAEYLNSSLPDYHFKIIPMGFDDTQLIVKNRLVDFVIVNSGIYIDLSVNFGVRRILTLVNKLSEGHQASLFGSVIFTLKSNSEIRHLEDLNNQRVAAVHPTSLGGWIMARRELLGAGLNTWDFSSLAFLNTHDAVVNSVLRREAEVGIVRTDTLERMALEGKLKLDDFYILSANHYDRFPYVISTPLYPEWPFALLPHTSNELARQVAIALLKLPSDHPAVQEANIYGWTIPENYQIVNDLLMLLEVAPYDQQPQEKLASSLKQFWYWYLIFALSLLFLIALGVRVIRLNRSLTEHKTTLESSRDAQVTTFELAAVGLAHLSLAGEFLRMNQRLCDILSLTQNEMEKINLKEIVHNDDIPTCINAFDQLRQKKQFSISIQLRMICANGATKWIQLSLSTKPNTKTQDEYLVAVIDDIDKYKKLEEENSQAQHLKELILDIAGDGIIGLDNQARHIFVNPAAANLLGYSVEEMLNKNSHTMWHYNHADGTPYPEVECPITEVLQYGNTRWEKHETVWCKNGTALEVEFICTPIKENNKVTGAVIVLHPLTNDQKNHKPTQAEL
jgi:PAS domain S-box-containing protein